MNDLYLKIISASFKHYAIQCGCAFHEYRVVDETMIVFLKKYLICEEELYNQLTFFDMVKIFLFYFDVTVDDALCYQVYSEKAFLCITEKNVYSYGDYDFITSVLNEKIKDIRNIYVIFCKDRLGNIAKLRKNKNHPSIQLPISFKENENDE